MCFSASHCVVTIRSLTNPAIHMKTIHYFNIYKYVFISLRRSTHTCKSTCRSWSSWPWLTTDAKLELSGFITVDITSVVITSKFFAVCHARRGLRWRVAISLLSFVESKGDKLFSSTECRIRTQRVSGIESPADWMPADKPTELSRIKLKTSIHSYIHTAKCELSILSRRHVGVILGLSQ